MEQQSQHTDYAQAIKTIKTAILQIRYCRAKSVNKGVLSLYYGEGEYISNNSRKGYWGTNAINVILQQLQTELPGLRGFSESNIKNTRIFYEAWSQHINRQSSSVDLGDNRLILDINNDSLNRQLSTDDFPKKEFLTIGFTHHIWIIAGVKDIVQRFFILKNALQNFGVWTN